MTVHAVRLWANRFRKSRIKDQPMSQPVAVVRLPRGRTFRGVVSSCVPDPDVDANMLWTVSLRKSGTSTEILRISLPVPVPPDTATQKPEPHHVPTGGIHPIPGTLIDRVLQTLKDQGPLPDWRTAQLLGAVPTSVSSARCTLVKRGLVYQSGYTQHQSRDVSVAAWAAC